MKRALCLLLSLVMVISMLPVSVFAETEEGNQEQTTITENAVVEGTNAIGELLSEDIQAEQSQQDEAAATGYNVVDLTVEGSLAYAEYSALDSAIVVVGIYDEEGTKLLASGSQAVEAGNGGVYVEISGDMPQYFRALAYLLDPHDYRPLCTAYETPMYTYEMQKLLASTVEDYDEELVLNLDDDTTTNFAVYNPGTIRLEEVAGVNTIVSADSATHTYVIENADKTVMSLVYGDVLSYAYGENEYLIVKVADTEIDGTTVTITGMDLEMQDVFSHVKIEADADTSAVEVDTTTADEAVTYEGMSLVDGPATFAWEGETSDKVEIKYTFYDVSFGDSGEEISFTGDLGLQIGFGLKYYIALSGSYIKFTTNIEAGLTLEAKGTLEKAYSLGDFFIPVIPGVNVGFSPEFKVEFEGEIEWSILYKQTVGFSFEGGEFKSLTTNPVLDYTCEAEITIFIGFDFNPNINIISPDVARLAASMPIGLEVKAATTGALSDGFDSYKEDFHGCALCLAGEVYFKFGLTAKLVLLDMDWLTFSVNLVEVKLPIDEFWFSFDKLDGGFGECPYKKYPVTIQTVDSEGQPVVSASVTPTDETYMYRTDENGTYQYYLEPGTYNISATKGDMAGSAEWEVDAPAKVVITLLVTGTVTDGVSWTLDKAGNLTVLGSGAIPDYANASAAPWYAYASQVKKVHVSDGITAVGANAFAGMANLSSAYLGAQVASIALSAFEGSEALSRLAVSPNNAAYCVDSQGVLYNKSKTVLYKAFLPVAANYILPESLTTVSGSAFAGQTGLANLTLPETLVSIGANAFNGCTALKLVTFTGPAPTIASNAFAGVTADAMYCIWDDGWTSDKLQNYGGAITWTGYDGLLGSGTCGDSAVWMLFDDGNLVISGSGAMADYAYNGMPWVEHSDSIVSVDIKEGITAIGEYAFYGCGQITKVVIPKSVTYIGKSAFYGCTAVTEVHISDIQAWCQVRLEYSGSSPGYGGGADLYLNGQLLTDVVIPDGTTQIGQYVFMDYDEIKTVSIPSSVEAIGYGAFYNSEGLQSVIIPEGVTGIEDYTFYGCTGLTSVVIPDGVTSIGEYAFMNCSSLNSVVIPKSVTSIGYDAFYGCTGLKKLTLNNGLSTIGDYAFYGCTSLETVAIPETVQLINAYAFADCEELVSVRFLHEAAEPCTVIGAFAFKSCDNLRDVRIGDSVTKIGESAFEGAKNLCTLLIGDSVTEIDAFAFRDCYALTDVTIGKGLQTVNTGAFYNCSKLQNVYISDLLAWISIQYSYNNAAPMSIAENLYLNNVLLTELTLPEGVESIGSYAFANCKNLVSVSLPASLTSIGDYAFYNCAGLTSAELPENLTTIGGSAFMFCSGLTAIAVPDKVTAIGDYAFRGCTAATAITLGESVATIGQYAFCNCSGVTSITVPDSVTTIGNYAFASCTGLETVKIGSGVTSIGSYAFSNCESLEGVAVPDKVTGIGDYAFSGCIGMASVTLGAKVKSIGAYAFAACAFDEITFPSALSSLGDGAFRNCSKLTDIVFLGSEPSFGANVFYGVTADAGYPLGWTETGLQDHGGSIYWYFLPTITSLSEDGTVTDAVQTEDIAAVDETQPEATAGDSGEEEQAALFASRARPLASAAAENAVAAAGTTAAKTVTYTGLDAGEEYVLLVLQSTQEQDLLAHENLVYIWQATADDTGTVSFTYCAREGAETVYELISGGKKRDLADATVTVPALYENGSAQLFMPQVSYGGKLLEEGVDYVLSGEISFVDAGSYTCYISGIGAYAGMYTCTYTVADDPGPAGMDYTLSTDGTYYSVTGIGSCTDTDIVIPAEYEGLPVKVIGSQAFLNCTNITSVVIPDSVEKIGAGAFSGCSGLVSMTIPFVGDSRKTAADTYQYPFGYIFGTDSYTGGTAVTQYYSNIFSQKYYIPDGLQSVTVTGGEILYGAFYKCSALTSITLADCVTGIGDSSFYNCSSLTSITIPDGVVGIGNSAFSGCSALTSVTIPDSVTGIGNSAFSGCSSLTSVTIPEGVTSIGDFAFSNCSSLTSITIPDSVTSIGNHAFYNCSSLTRVDITDVAAWCNIVFGGSYSNPVQYAKNLYLNGELVTEVEFPEGLTSVSDYAFFNCVSLTSVIIPKGITSIGSSAFYGCSSLTDITISDEINSIGSSAFYGCSSLAEITIPDGVISIGGNAFYNCSSLTSVVIPEGVTSISGSTFYGCSSLTSVVIPEGVTSIGDSAFYGCSSLSSIIIPDGVTTIWDRAFYGCTGLTAASVPESITYFGDEVFGACWLSFNVYDNANYLGNSQNPYAVLVECWNLASCEIHPQTKCIAERAFAGCSSMTEITIPKGVIGIGPQAFYNCSSLIKVNITDIAAWCNIYFGGSGANPLQYARKLYLNGKLVTDLVIPDSVTSIGFLAFSGCSSLTSVTIPGSVTSIGDSAFNGCSSLTSVTMADSVTSIGVFAFSGCSSLTSIEILDGVTSIGGYAFSGCSSLTSVKIPDGVTSMGYEVFGGCTALESITIPFVGSCREPEREYADYPFGYIFGSTSSDGCTATTQNRYNISFGTTRKYYIPNSLKTVTVTGGKLPIGAFENCNNITSITLSENVTGIGMLAFANCSGLEKVIFGGDAPSIGGSAFQNVTATAYYLSKNDTWTEDVRQNYGGTITWATYSDMAIVTQPTDVVIAAGSTVAFTVEASGTDLSYQWKYSSDDGVTWSNCGYTGYDTATLTLTAWNSRNGFLFRCVVTDGDGYSLTSDTAKLIINTIVIAEHPADQTVIYGKNAAFTVEASGTDLVYRWQQSTDGGVTWTNCTLSGYNTKTLTVAAYTSRDQNLYRCMLTDGNGATETSASAKLTVNRISIETQPADQVVKYGENAVFAVSASGIAPSYQWQRSTDGGVTWSNCTYTGYNTATLTVVAYTSRQGNLFRCVITDSNGATMTTDTAKLTVNNISIQTQPSDQCVKLSTDAVFTVAATGDSLTYQWQTKDAAGEWVNATYTGYNTDSMTVKCLTSRNGKEFRCVITDALGNQEITETATLSILVEDFRIVTQPTNQEVKVKNVATFTIEANDAYTYRWEVSSDNGATWTEAAYTGYNTASMRVGCFFSRVNKLFRCVVTDPLGNTLISDSVKMVLVADPIEFVTEPGDISVAYGATASMLLEANNVVYYSWEESFDGGKTWSTSTMAGCATKVIRLPANDKRDGSMYRCKLINGYNEVSYSNVYTMDVVKITEQPESTFGASGKKATFSAAVDSEDVTYQWQYSKDSGVTWINYTGDSSTYTNKVVITYLSSGSRKGWLVRCAITGTAGTAMYTNAARLCGPDEQIEITSAPVDYVGAAGSTATFTVEATNVVAYQWQYSTDGITWINVTGNASAATKRFSRSNLNSWSGRQIRCAMTDISGAIVYTDPVTMSVKTS